MDLQSFNCEVELVAAFWAVAAVALYDLARGLELKPSVQQVATFGTYDLLRRQIAR